MPTVLGVKDGSISANIELKQSGSVSIPEKEFDIIYIVMSDNNAQDEDDIIDTPGIPPRWYPIAGAVAVGHTADQIETVHNPMSGVLCDIWHVTVHFSTRAVPDSCEDDPICKRPKVRWYGETVDEVMDYTADGKPVTTDAGEKIIVTQPTTIAVLEITRYENAPFDPDVILLYGNHANSHDFWGAPPGSALMATPESDEEVINNVTYCRTVYTIRFKLKDHSILANLLIEALGGLGDADTPAEVAYKLNENSWAFVALHQGYLFRKAPNAVPEIAVDKHGQPVTVNLKAGTGEKLAIGQPPNYKAFTRHPRANFNALALGPF